MSKIPITPKFGDEDLVTSAEGGGGAAVGRKNSLNIEHAKNKVWQDESL